MSIRHQTVRPTSTLGTSNRNPRHAEWLLVMLLPVYGACGSSSPGNTGAGPSGQPTAPSATASPATTSPAIPSSPTPASSPSEPSPATTSNATTTTPGVSSSGANTNASDSTSATTPSSDGESAPAISETSEESTTSEVASGSFTVQSQLASELDEAAPTTVGIVTWSTTVTAVEAAHIEFGLTTDYGMQAPVDLAAENYRTLLLGMKPQKTYHFRVVADTSAGSVVSEDYTIETGPKTTAVAIGAFEVLDADKREPGFTVASYWSGTGSSVAYILDADGEIVWAFDTGMTGGIARARISEDGKDMWVISASNNGTTLRRVGIDGLGAETYPMTVGSHDITPVTGATMAFLEYGETDCDSIFEIVPSGETKEIWDSQDLSAGGGGGSRCHGNAVRYSAAEGVYTFSDVSTDLVQLSREGELQWKLTEKVSGGIATWGGVQHGHHLLQDSIVVFANSGSQSHDGASAVIEYALADGAEIWRYEGANGEMSANLGDAQRLPGGNTLVTFSNDSIVHEVTPDGTLVLEWKGSASTRIGYTEWRPTLYGGSPMLHD